MSLYPDYRNRLITIIRHPANRGAGGKALVRAAKWFFQAHVLRRPLVVETADGIRLRMYPDSIMAKEWFYFDGYRANDALIFVDEFLRPGDAFLDLGANVGVFTCLGAARVGEAGRVDSVEASPRTFARLEGNVALNGFRCVHAWHNALGDTNASIRFTVAGDTVNHVVTADADRAATGQEEVPMKRLDDLLAQDGAGPGRYALAKLDVEGYELPCLRGASGLLARQAVDIWLIEVNGSSRRYGFSDEAIYALMKEHGYRLTRYDARRKSTQVAADFGDDILAVSPAGEKLLETRLGVTLPEASGGRGPE